MENLRERGSLLLGFCDAQLSQKRLETGEVQESGDLVLGHHPKVVDVVKDAGSTELDLPSNNISGVVAV